jgi:hypothetical protein
LIYCLRNAPQTRLEASARKMTHVDGATWLGRLFSSILPSPYDLISTSTEGRRMILDLGCGPRRKVTIPDRSFVVGLDAFRQYLESRRSRNTEEHIVQGDGASLCFRGDCFDLVLCLDVLEHFTGPRAASLLGEIKRTCTGLVVVFTPNGFVPQSAVDDNPHQRHESGWSAKDLERLGFHVYGVGGLRLFGKRLPRGDGIEFAMKSRALRLLTRTSTLILLNLPRIASSLLAFYSRDGRSDFRLRVRERGQNSDRSL